MRTEVLKTYKIYINGSFPRTESGRFYALKRDDKHVANICLSSRKDLRNAVEAADKAFEGWTQRAAFNRSQILYRIAEMMESRKAQFVNELVIQGYGNKDAEEEVIASIDRVFYYAGWCDKYQQVFSSVNPVSSSHFNFSVLEANGVVGIIQNDDSSLLGMVSSLIPVIAGGNTTVFLADNKWPLTAISFAEVLENSDVPAGVINILTGVSDELLPHYCTHMNIKALLVLGNDKAEEEFIREKAVVNLKRVTYLCKSDWNSDKFESPYSITDYQEIKTTWHPIENIGVGGAKY